jgi:hypothetical protein
MAAENMLKQIPKKTNPQTGQEPETLITASGRNVIDRSSGFIQASAWALMGFLLLSQDLLAKNAAIIGLGLKILLKNLDEFFIGFFIIVLLLVTLLKRYPTIRLPLLLPVGGIVLLGCISSLWNRVPPSIWTVQMFLTLKGFFLFYLFTNTRLNAENVKAVTKGVASLGLALLGLGVIDFCCPEEPVIVILIYNRRFFILTPQGPVRFIRGFAGRRFDLKSLEEDKVNHLFVINSRYHRAFFCFLA